MPLGRETAYTYDGQGNVASVTRLNGTAEAVTTSFTYEPPGMGTYNRLTSLTTPIATSTLAYNDPARTIGWPWRSETRFSFGCWCRPWQS